MKMTNNFLTAPRMEQVWSQPHWIGLPNVQRQEPADEIGG